jgi:hypothetical protein
MKYFAVCLIIQFLYWLFAMSKHDIDYWLYLSICHRVDGADNKKDRKSGLFNQARIRT